MKRGPTNSLPLPYSRRPFGRWCPIGAGREHLHGCRHGRHSVRITARVLASRGLLDKRASRIILTAAVVDDVLGLIVLALPSAMEQRGQLPGHRVDRVPKPARYNIGDVTKYIRYQSASGVSYGTLEGDTVHQIQGGLFDRLTPTGKTHKLSGVKLLYPCEPGKIMAVGLNLSLIHI